MCGSYSQHLVILLEDLLHLLKMQTLKAATSAIIELNTVILEPPLLALQWYDVVDVGEKLRYCEVLGGGAGPEELDLWESVPADGQAQANVISRHGEATGGTTALFF